MEQFINSIKEWKPKIIELSEVNQTAMHSFVEEAIKKDPKISYQDATNTFLILRISQLQFELGRLWASQPSILDNYEKH